MEKGRIIITGGTNGLGLELVRLFLDRGFEVLSLGRTNGKVVHPCHRFYPCDFSSLSRVQETARQIVKMGERIDLIISNAGILSPPEYTKTMDGFELSYQINFLAHVHFFRVLKDGGILNNTTIINTTSPLRLRGKLEQDWVFDKYAYRSIKAYASTKLYMSLFARHLAVMGFSSYAFDPGTFSSGIYRAQKPWFHVMYKIAAPFMAPSSRVARDFMRVFDIPEKMNGYVYNRKGAKQPVDQFSMEVTENFYMLVDEQIRPFLNL